MSIKLHRLGGQDTHPTVVSKIINAKQCRLAYTGLEFDKTLLEGDDNGVGAVSNAEFSDYVSYMEFNRVFGNVEFTADQFVVFTLGHKH